MVLEIFLSYWGRSLDGGICGVVVKWVERGNTEEDGKARQA